MFLGEKKFPKSNFSDKYQHFCRFNESNKLKDAKENRKKHCNSLENPFNSLRKRLDFLKIIKKAKKVAKLLLARQSWHTQKAEKRPRYVRFNSMHFKFITKHYLDTTLFRKSHGQNVAAIPIFRTFLHVVFDGPITAFLLLRCIYIHFRVQV